MSSVYRNLKKHQTLALMDPQQWAHNINLHKLTEEMNHQVSNITAISFNSCDAFTSCAECVLTILILTTTLRNEIYLLQLTKHTAHRQSGCVGQCLWVSSNTHSHRHNVYNLVARHPSLAKGKNRGYRYRGHIILGMSSDSTASCVNFGVFLNLTELQFPFL